MTQKKLKRKCSFFSIIQYTKSYRIQAEALQNSCVTNKERKKVEKKMFYWNVVEINPKARGGGGGE